MKNKNVRGILALAVVTALSFGVIYGSHTFSEKFAAENTQTAQEGQSEVLEELDTEGFDGIEKAVKTSDGYLVTVRTKGYGGDIVMDVAFDAEGKTVTKVTVKEQTETEGVGSKITETEFLSQFEGVEAPVYLPGMNVPMTLEETGEETPAADQEEDLLKDAVLADGDYIAKGQPDDNGLTDQVTMTVKDGKITAVNWDAIGEDGTKKSEMSENGEYVMTEDGPTWKEQAEALAQTLVENQTLDVFTMDEQGKTDAVSGVSISIGGFVSLAQDCLNQAAGVETPEETPAETEAPEDGTVVDGVSGATISSTAAVNAVNMAFDFLNAAK